MVSSVAAKYESRCRGCDSPAIGHAHNRSAPVSHGLLGCARRVRGGAKPEQAANFFLACVASDSCCYTNICCEGRRFPIRSLASPALGQNDRLFAFSTPSRVRWRLAHCRAAKCCSSATAACIHVSRQASSKVLLLLGFGLARRPTSASSAYPELGQPSTWAALRITRTPCVVHLIVLDACAGGAAVSVQMPPSVGNGWKFPRYSKTLPNTATPKFKYSHKGL